MTFWECRNLIARTEVEEWNDWGRAPERYGGVGNVLYQACGGYSTACLFKLNKQQVKRVNFTVCGLFLNK